MEKQKKQMGVKEVQRQHDDKDEEIRRKNEEIQRLKEHLKMFQKQ